jgi:hypothetical protein
VAAAAGEAAAGEAAAETTADALRAARIGPCPPRS